MNIYKAHVSPANAFPSPCGEKVGINTVVVREGVDLFIVSVPLRGKGRDQRVFFIPEQGRLYGFRPLAGKR